jgi:hypothetical protein
LIKVELRKPAGLIGFYFRKFENDLSIWHKVKSDSKGEQTIVETLKLNKE